MYILIDTERMAIVYRCEKVETIRALANIELSHANSRILEETYKKGYPANVEQLQNLFKNLTGGTNPHSFDHNYLIDQIIRLCLSAEPSKVDAFEATVQSMQIKNTDRDYYKYAKGASRATILKEPFVPPPLVGNWKAAQGLPLPSTAPAQPAPAQAPRQPQPWAVAPAATPPKYAPPWA